MAIVVFDPADLEILRILGLAGVVMGGAAAAAPPNLEAQ